MIWLVGLLCALLLVALVARAAALLEAKRSGLPAGVLLYGDTGMPVGRITPIMTDHEGVRQEKPLVSEALGLVGRPDYLVRTREGVIPIEVKSAACPPGRTPYDSHVAQLAAYCLLVEDVLGAPPHYGVIRYRDCEVRVDYTREVRDGLLALLGEMRKARAADEVHRSHQEARRCAKCSMRDVCDESLA